MKKLSLPSVNILTPKRKKKAKKSVTPAKTPAKSGSVGGSPTQKSDAPVATIVID